jgi:hypothetical protein
MRRPVRRFAFRLALALGMTVRELLSRVDSYELSEWMAYGQIEPFGPHADDRRHGERMALTANIHRDAKRRARPFEAADFMLGMREPRQPQPPELVMRGFQMLAKYGTA